MALVLSRKKNESIVIDGKTIVTMTSVRGNEVRLGIKAITAKTEHVVVLKQGESTTIHEHIVVDDTIVSDNGIVVMVVAIKGQSVRLSIEAPDYMPVHRQEVHEAIQGDQLWRDELLKRFAHQVLTHAELHELREILQRLLGPPQ